MRVIAIPYEVRHVKIKFALFLALVFVCGCSCAFANATYTDRFDSPFSGCGCYISYFGGQAPNPLLEYDGHGLLTGFSFANFQSPNFLEAWMQVGFIAQVSSYSESVNCDYSPCLYLWNGTLDGGSTNIAATIETLSADGVPTYTDLSFTGTISRGAFWGSFENCTGTYPCGSSVVFLMNIEGTWSNGWKSSGPVSVYGDFSDGLSYTMTLTTTTVPEPGSLVLLGSGLTVLAGALRRKLW